MKIVVNGGGGLIGSRLVDKLRQLDHIVIAASPQFGIDSITREGLDGALKNADVVVDVSNSRSLQGGAPMDFFQRSTMNLITAEAYAGVRHHIALSLVGADRLPDSGYYRAKVMQEDIVKESGVPYTILRSTQFFELAGRIVQEGTIGEEIHISPAAFQPIAAEEVVTVLADIVSGRPVNSTVEVAGPVPMPMYEFIRYYLNAMEDSRQLIEDGRALYLGAELNEDSLLPGENPRLGEIKYEDWFARELVN